MAIKHIKKAAAAGAVLAFLLLSPVKAWAEQGSTVIGIEEYSPDTDYTGWLDFKVEVVSPEGIPQSGIYIVVRKAGAAEGGEAGQGPGINGDKRFLTDANGEIIFKVYPSPIVYEAYIPKQGEWGDQICGPYEIEDHTNITIELERFKGGGGSGGGSDDSDDSDNSGGGSQGNAGGGLVGPGGTPTEPSVPAEPAVPTGPFSPDHPADAGYPVNPGQQVRLSGPGSQSGSADAAAGMTGSKEQGPSSSDSEGTKESGEKTGAGEGSGSDTEKEPGEQGSQETLNRNSFTARADRVNRMTWGLAAVMTALFLVRLRMITAGFKRLTEQEGRDDGEQ